MLDVIEVSQRVEKGAALLDEVNPGWVDYIQVDSLDMTDEYLCVLGQVTGVGYWTASEDLFGDDAGAASIQHGFDLLLLTDHWTTHERQWETLKSAWVGLITVRRSRAKATL